MKVPALVVSCTALAVCAAAAGGRPGPGRIVFAANGAPSTSGHVYVAHGARAPVDLSARSGGLDSVPAVSPDGSRIAFASVRGGHVAVYTMAVDGGDVVRISPSLGPGGPDGDATVAKLVWRPDGKMVAALVLGRRARPGAVYASGPKGGWRLLAGALRQPSDLVGWTADGRLLVYVSQDTGGVEGVDAAGSTRFDVPGLAAALSARGTIAVQRDSETWVVDSEAGRQLARLEDVASAGWSPDGSLLATVGRSGTLRLRGEKGRTLLSARFAQASFLGWAANRVVRLSGPTGVFGVSAVTGKRVPLAAALRQYTVVASRDGSRFAALVYPPTFTGTSVRLVEVGPGGSTRTLARFPACADDPPLADLQLFGKDGVAFDTACPGADADIYAVAPDGSALGRLTHTPLDETEPAVSPDGSTIAFVQKDNELRCGGCPETLRVMSADGSDVRSIPNSPTGDLPYDEHPSFSPDGRTILFDRSGPSATKLVTVPVSGGPVRDLGVSGSYPSWGPARIAYLAWPSGTASTMAADGTDREPVGGAGAGGPAAWSADGRLAYLQTDERGALSILVPAAGRRIRLPELTAPYDAGLAWSPDGTRFAFPATDREGIADVWTVASDGTGLTRVTHGLGAVSSVAWR